MATIDADIPCVRCQHSLRGETLRGACTSCGLAVEESLHLAAIDEAQLTVIADVACVHCDYNLKTLSIGSRCPECGELVAASLRPIELAFASKSWLADLRFSATTLILLLLLPWLTLLGAIESVLSILAAIIIVPGLPLLLLGSLFAVISFCSTEHGRPHSGRGLNLGWWCGACLLGGGFSFLLSLGASSAGPSDVAAIVAAASAIFAVACLTGIVVCIMTSIRRLAVRGRDRGLQRIALLSAVTVVSMPAVTVLWAGLELLAPAWFSSSRLRTSGLPELCLGILVLAAYVSVLVTLIRCRRMLSVAIKRQPGG